MTTRTVILGLSLSLAMAGCTLTEGEKPQGWAAQVEDRSISRFMGQAVAQLAQGDDAQWNEMVRIWKAGRLDGIAATCFEVGLGELLARAPTVFLERHLAGDESALALARQGYRLLYADEVQKTQKLPQPRLNVAAARANALRLFRQRQSMSDEETREKIEAFISHLVRPGVAGLR